jgi:hypothetical protein
MADEVSIITGPTYQYVESLSGSFWVKVELIKSNTLVDDYRGREMIYHQTSYAETVTGEYETLYFVPFGLAAVSGTDYR